VLKGVGAEVGGGVGHPFAHDARAVDGEFVCPHHSRCGKAGVGVGGGGGGGGDGGTQTPPPDPDPEPGPAGGPVFEGITTTVIEEFIPVDEETAQVIIEAVEELIRALEDSGIAVEQVGSAVTISLGGQVIPPDVPPTWGIGGFAGTSFMGGTTGFQFIDSLGDGRQQTGIEFMGAHTPEYAAVNVSNVEVKDGALHMTTEADNRGMLLQSPNYANNAFTPEVGKTYTIVLNVASLGGANQIRLGNNMPGEWWELDWDGQTVQNFTLSEDGTEIIFSWTQGADNPGGLFLVLAEPGTLVINSLQIFEGAPTVVDEMPPTLVTVPMAEETDPFTITTMAILNADGSLTPVPTRVDETGKVTVLLSGSGDVTLVPLSVEAGFTDTDGFSDEVAKEIERAAALMIVNGIGDGLFGGGAEVTNQQAVTMFLRALGVPVDYETAMGTAAANGLIGDDTTAGEPMTRIETAVLIMNAMNSVSKTSMSLDKAKEVIGAFSDLDGLTEEETIAMAICIELGIFKGAGGGIMNPNDPLQRSQMASLAVRLQDEIMK
jgi:hypothetical protein